MTSASTFLLLFLSFFFFAVDMDRDLALEPKDLFVVLLVFSLSFEHCTGRISIVSARMPVLTSGHPLSPCATLCLSEQCPEGQKKKASIKVMAGVST